MKPKKVIFLVTLTATEQSGGHLGVSGKIHSVYVKPRHKGNTNEPEVLREGRRRLEKMVYIWI